MMSHPRARRRRTSWSGRPSTSSSRCTSAGQAGRNEERITYGPAEFVLGLPPLGEGDRSPGLHRKVDIPGPSRWERRLRQGGQTTAGVPRLPAGGSRHHGILSIRKRGRAAHPSYGSAGTVFRQGTGRRRNPHQSLHAFQHPVGAQHRVSLLQGIEQFLNRLLDLFARRPEHRVSISPNNIYVLSDGGKYRDPVSLVLIDPGPRPEQDLREFFLPQVLEPGASQPDLEVSKDGLSPMAGSPSRDPLRTRRGAGASTYSAI